MGLLDGLRAWLTWDGPQVRAAGPPIRWEPSFSNSFGPGIASQPAHATLLRESLGIAAGATRRIADSISRLEPIVKESRTQMDGTAVEENLDDHPLKVLLDHPHPHFSRAKSLRLLTQWLLTTGEAYQHKVRAANPLAPTPMRLDPVNPTMVRPLVELGEVTGYLVTDAMGNQEVRPADEFIRFFFPDPENHWGAEGFLGPMGTEVDAHKFSQQHLRAHYQHDATPKSTLEAGELAQSFTQEQRERFHQQWQQQYNTRIGTLQGLPMILPTGYKLVQMGLQTGADITPLLEHWRDDILMHWGVPRAVLGQVTSGDRSSAEVVEWVYEKHTLTPITMEYGDGWTTQLASEFPVRDVRVCFEEFATDDKQHTLAQEQSDLDRRVRSINEIREERGLDPVPWGEMPQEPMTEEPDEPEEEEDEDPEALAAEERAAHIALRQRYRARKRRARERAAHRAAGAGHGAGERADALRRDGEHGLHDEPRRDAAAHAAGVSP